MRHKLLIIGIIMLGVGYNCIGQRYERFLLNKYTTKDGLSSYNVRKIIQDKYGFIWVATQYGLNRYDGREFMVYEKNGNPKRQLSGADTRDIIEDRSKNMVWAIGSEGGIDGIELQSGKVIKSIKKPVSYIDDWNITLLLNKDELWIGSFNGLKIYSLLQDKFVDHPLLLQQAKAIKDQFEAHCLAIDPNQNIWVCYSGYGIVVLNPATKKVVARLPVHRLNMPHDGVSIRFLKSILINDSTFLFATNCGLRKISFNASYDFNIDNAPCHTLPQLNFTAVSCIQADGKNHLFIAGNSHLYRFERDLSDPVVYEEASTLAESDWLKNVTDIYTDKNDNLWLGCKTGLAFSKPVPSLFEGIYYDPVSKIKLEHLLTLCPIATGDVLAGSTNGLYLVDKHRNFHLLDSMNQIEFIFRDAANNMLVSTSSGVKVYKNNRLVDLAVIYPELAAYQGYTFNSHVGVGDSISVLGTESNRGILVWNHRSGNCYLLDAHSKPVSLAANIVNKVFKDSKDRIWVLSDKAITVLSADLKHSDIIRLIDKKMAEPYSIYFDVCEAAGYYWIAAYGYGLMQLDAGYHLQRIYSTDSGLCNNGVYKVFNWNNKKLIVTTNNGLSVFDLARHGFKNYYKEDGLHSNAFEEGCGVDAEGKIYAGGVNGYSVINPLYFSLNTEPPVLFANKVIYKTARGMLDSYDLHLKEVRVPNYVLQSRIQFAALNSSNPGKSKFEYRVGELNEQWIGLGEQNFIDFVGLPPGTYHLQVKAANEDGVWSNPIELSLTFLPKWYQTWWFKIAILLAVMAVAYGFYRMRINQLKRVEAIRRKLASDLHDDLGSTLNSVKVYASLAMSDRNDASYLLKIKESTQEAISGIRDIIWVLDDKRDTIEHIIGRIRQFAQPLCEANGITFATQIDEHLYDYKLEKEEKRNLYMIMKESINNSIKYAACKHIEVVIASASGRLSVRITDDGAGFDIKTITFGNGIKNIETRAKEVGYKANVVSFPGNGTLVHLQRS